MSLFHLLIILAGVAIVGVIIYALIIVPIQNRKTLKKIASGVQKGQGSD